MPKPQKLYLDPKTPQIETFTEGDIRRLAAAKGLSVSGVTMAGTHFLTIEEPDGKTLISSEDLLHLAYFLQGKIPPSLEFKDVKKAAKQRNLHAGRKFSPMNGETVYMIMDLAGGDLVMGGNDLAALWVHLQNTPAYPAE